MIDEVAAVVPARDEQGSLPECLRALRVAGAELNASYPTVKLRIVIVLDECTDGSLEELTGDPRLETLSVRARSAGGARAAGTQHVLASTASRSERIWLANTDADSAVPRHWLVEMVGQALRGAHLVLGTVEPDDDLEPSLRQRWRDGHVLTEGHPHVHGANFGIRGDSYLRLGGWAAVATGEDVDLADRAAREADLVIVRTPRIPVITSSRRTSRAPGGFATFLTKLARPPLTEQAS